jgi:hypothetical protein
MGHGRSGAREVAGMGWDGREQAAHGERAQQWCGEMMGCVRIRGSGEAGTGVAAWMWAGNGSTVLGGAAWQWRERCAGRDRAPAPSVSAPVPVPPALFGLRACPSACMARRQAARTRCLMVMSGGSVPRLLSLLQLCPLASPPALVPASAAHSGAQAIQTSCPPPPSLSTGR